MQTLKTEIPRLGYNKALIVTDENLVKAGLTKFITNLLDEIEIDYILFDQVQANPTITNVEDGSNVKARSDMAYAEYLAGMAFSNASLGYVYAMAHRLGGYYNLAHGVCNAILLPHVQSINKQVCAHRLADVAKFMGIDTRIMTDDVATDALIELIISLSGEIGIPDGLAELNVQEADLELLATNALNDACGLTNPIQATHEQIVNIFKDAM